MNGLRYSLRALMRTPVVSLVVVISLGLGIGANTAIFSLMHQTLLKTLPVAEPETLVVVTTVKESKSGRSSTSTPGGMESIFSYPKFRAMEKNPQGLEGVAGYRTMGVNLSFRGKTNDGSALLVSGGYFPLLGTPAFIGRLLTKEDDAGAGQPNIVLSYGYWRDRLGGRMDIVNQPLRVNSKLYTVVGVAPKGFTGVTLGEEPDVFVPMVFKPEVTPGEDGRERWDDYWIYVFGRRKAGESLAKAEEAFNGMYAGVTEEQAKAVKGRGPKYYEQLKAARVKLLEGAQGASQQRESMETPLRVLMVCTALVLLIAAANAANLLLARAVQRTRELAIRTALGASSGAILRQLLTESLLLSGAGGLMGLLLGSWVLDLLIGTMNPDNPTYQYTSRLEWPVLLFSLGVTLLTGLLSGLYPAWAAARGSMAGTLKEDSANASASRGGVRVRKALVMAQVAVSLLLLIPMGLFLKSLVNLMRVDLGVKTENLVTFRISPELNGYQPARSRQLFERVENELAATPGVSAVTVAMVPLISGWNWGTDLNVEGFSSKDGNNNSRMNRVGVGYFGKLGVPLVKGREFTMNDTEASPKVAVVNEAWVAHFMPGNDPIGRTFGDEGDKSPRNITVVGVVKNFHYASVKEKQPILFYQPYRQIKEIGAITFYVRSALPVAQVAAQIRRVVGGADPDLPIENMRTLEDQVQRNISNDRLVLQLAAAFGVLATVLAMLGLYGVLAFGVARRTREFGIRMALGANAVGVAGLVLKEVALILTVGMVLGVPSALFLARLAESQLFGVKANDVPTILGALAALVVAALAAGLLPARRATRVNPVQALRYE